MWGRGSTVGWLVIILIILLAAASWWHTQQLAEQRTARIAALLMTPEYQHCIYDSTTCPQIEGGIQVPNYLGFLVVILAVLIAGYLMRSDQAQQQILKELRAADQKTQHDEQLDLVLSVLKADERKTLLAIKEQPGITQNTLRLRTDFSKGKLSMLLKELETRQLVSKEAEGKTNKLYVKRKL